MEKLNIILAAGGTGGHIFPAHALAEELHTRSYNSILITDKRYNRFAMKNANLGLEYITAATLYSRGGRKIIAFCMIFMGFIKAAFLLKKYKAKIVIGFGGYPSFPTLMAARIMNIPIIIHEQNSAIGRVNRYFSRYSLYIATSFKNTAGIGHFKDEKIYFTGNPVRKEISEIGKTNYPEILEILNILVIGGSQGASIFSKIIPEAFALLPENIQEKINLVQQCQKEDLEEVKTKYQNTKIKAELNYFFNDINLKLKDSHLVIARGGASTIAELEAAKRPGIIVPIPNSFENHQMYNARSFTENGVGIIMTQENFTAQNLAIEIEKIIKNKNILPEFAKKFEEKQHSAVQKLADLVQSIIKTL